MEIEPCTDPNPISQSQCSCVSCCRWTHRLFGFALGGLSVGAVIQFKLDSTGAEYWILLGVAVLSSP